MVKGQTGCGLHGHSLASAPFKQVNAIELLFLNRIFLLFSRLFLFVLLFQLSSGEEVEDYC